MFVLKMHLLLRWVSGFFCASIIASLVVQLVKNPPAMQETLVRFLGREDPLEEEMTTHSSILAWEIPWTEEPGRVQSKGLQKRWKGLSNRTTTKRVKRDINANELTNTK